MNAGKRVPVLCHQLEHFLNPTGRLIEIHNEMRPSSEEIDRLIVESQSGAIRSDERFELRVDVV